jgi:hypothetical protein
MENTMANKTMTYKDFYETVIKANISAEVTAKAKDALSKLSNKTASKDKAKSENTKANLAIASEFAKVMKPNTIYAVSEIKALTKSELHPSKISAICRAAVDNGMFSVVEGYKVGGKGSLKKGYSLIVSEVVEDTEDTEDESIFEDEDEDTEGDFEFEVEGDDN